MEKVIFALADKIKQAGATDGYFIMHNIRHTKGITAVISVYANIKPAHEVLEELYKWAEINNSEVKELIEKIGKDMSWNDGNPV